MPRGGRRTGTPGKSYSNRTDLTPTAAPGQQYGMAGAQLAAQGQMPMGAQPIPQAAPPSPPPAPTGEPPIQPGQFGDLLRPTERPDEPLTAGAPHGPGPSQAQIGIPPQPVQQWQTTKDFVSSLAAQHNSPALQTLLTYLNVGA